jgi:hypothetical protein
MRGGIWRQVFDKRPDLCYASDETDKHGIRIIRGRSGKDPSTWGQLGPNVAYGQPPCEQFRDHCYHITPRGRRSA